MDYLDSNGLSYYDSKIKGHIDSVIENSVLPMIPKKGVVALGNNGYVTGGQVYNAIGSGGGGGTVTAEYPFPYVKIKKCKFFSAFVSDTYSSGAETSTIYDYHTSDGTVSPQIIEKINSVSRLAFYKEDFPTGKPIPFEDKFAFDASFFFPPQCYLVPPSSGLTSYSSYTSEGEMEIHNYLSVSSRWMTTKDSISKSTIALCPSVLKIDDKIKYIGESAFYKSNLTLYISAVEPPIIQTNSFYTFKEIHVPSGSLDLYKSANNWSAYGDYMIGDL